MGEATAPAGIVTVTPKGSAVVGGAASTPPLASMVAAAARGVSRRSTATVPTVGATTTSRSTAVAPAFEARSSVGPSPRANVKRPRPSVAADAVDEARLAATVAPARGSPVASESTWPSAAPSAPTRTPRDADALLPARSVASATTVRVSPVAAQPGTDKSKANGGAESVGPAAAHESRPATNTRKATLATPTASVTVATIGADCPRAIRSGAVRSTRGGVVSRVTSTASLPVWPEPEVATAVIVLSPSSRARDGSEKRERPRAEDGGGDPVHRHSGEGRGLHRARDRGPWRYGSRGQQPGP